MPSSVTSDSVLVNHEDVEPLQWESAERTPDLGASGTALTCALTDPLTLGQVRAAPAKPIDNSLAREPEQQGRHARAGSPGCRSYTPSTSSEAAGDAILSEHAEAPHFVHGALHASDLDLGPAVSGLAPISEEEEDAQAAQATAPCVLADTFLEPVYLNILVCGDSGLGKSTFIANLFNSFVPDGMQLRILDSTGTTAKAFQEDPAKLCTQLPRHIPLGASGKRLVVCVQDTPGHSDDPSAAGLLRTIMEFIIRRRLADHTAQCGWNDALKETVGRLEHSFSLCLYFLPPHRLKPVDLIFMSVLSQQVPVMPIISKADSMTADEAAAFKALVNATLSSPKEMRALTGSEQLVKLVQFRRDDLKSLGICVPSDGAPASNKALPSGSPSPTVAAPALAVVACSEVDEAGRFVRKYMWGQCKGMDRAHSDTILVKRLLTGDRTHSLENILQATRASYHAFCTQYEQQHKGRSVDARIRALVEAACWWAEPRLMGAEEYARTQGLQRKVVLLQVIACGLGVLLLVLLPLWLVLPPFLVLLLLVVTPDWAV